MKMSPKLSLFLSFFILFHIGANAFDITQILNQYPEFSSFNSYLTQSKLAADINSRQTITVLVVDNGNASPLSGLSPDAVKNALSLHVVLDYFDVAKIQKLSSKTTTVTTLFQASGNARGQQGFLNITRASADSITFGSAAAGSATVSSLLKSVMSQPYNISVLQVSNVIIPPEATNSTSGNSTTSPPSPPPPAKTPSAAPSKSPTASPPKSSPAPPKSSPAPPKSSPAPSNGSEAPAEAATPPPTASGTAPAADAPAASTPTADAPAATPPAAADAPPSDKPSGSGKAAHVGVSVVLAVVVSAVCLASKV